MARHWSIIVIAAVAAICLGIAAPAQTPATPGQLHALVYIGDQSARQASPLSPSFGMRFTASAMHLDADAKDFIAAMHELNVSDVHLLANPNTSQEALDTELNQMSQGIAPQDTMLVYVAARLYMNDDMITGMDLSQIAMELGPNGPPDVSMAHLMARLRHLPCRNLVLVLLNTDLIPLPQLAHVILNFPQSPTGSTSSVAILASDLFSIHEGRSELSRNLIHGLQGAADLEHSGVINSASLQLYLKQASQASIATAADKLDPSYIDRSWTSFTQSTPGPFPVLAKEASTSRPGARIEPTSEAKPSSRTSPAPIPIAGLSRGMQPLDQHAVTAAAPVPQPKTYALLFATDHYDRWAGLHNPIADAQALSKSLHDLYGVETQVVSDPSTADVNRILHEYLSRKYDPNSQLLIFFSGHGYLADEMKLGYFVFRDAQLPADDPAHISLLPFDQVLRYAENIPVQHLLLIADTCYSGALDSRIAEGSMRGNLFGGISSVAALAASLRVQSDRKTRRFLTSGGRDFVPDGPAGGHSPFNSALLLTLAKDAEEHGYTNWLDLQNGLVHVIPEPHKGSIGNSDNPNGDFILLTPQMQNALQETAMPTQP